MCNPSHCETTRMNFFRASLFVWRLICRIMLLASRNKTTPTDSQHDRRRSFVVSSFVVVEKVVEVCVCAPRYTPHNESNLEESLHSHAITNWVIRSGRFSGRRALSPVLQLLREQLQEAYPAYRLSLSLSLSREIHRRSSVTQSPV